MTDTHGRRPSPAVARVVAHSLSTLGRGPRQPDDRLDAAARLAPDAAAAHAVLANALADARAARLRVPCIEAWSDMWTAEDRELLEAAARACAGCPVTTECATAGWAAGEHGVWGGAVLQQGNRRGKGGDAVA